jgi:hypothetical protein
MPDPNLTPGCITHVASQDVAAGRRPTPTARRVTHATKRYIFMSYGIPDQDDALYEIDHLVPLELGGSNAPSNLWPQPIVSTYTGDEKDRLENNVHAMVARGTITPVQAINLWAYNWVDAYRLLVNLDDSVGSLAILCAVSPRVEAQIAQPLIS